MADEVFLSWGRQVHLPVGLLEGEGRAMNTLIIFVILTASIIALLIWCVIEDDRDERRRK